MLAVGVANTRSTAQVEYGAHITVGGAFNVTADIVKTHSVNANAGAFGAGKFALSIVVSVFEGQADAALEGTVVANKTISVLANLELIKNKASVNSSVGSGAGAKFVGGIKTLPGKVFKKVGGLIKEGWTLLPIPFAAAPAILVSVHDQSVSARIGPAADAELHPVTKVESKTGEIVVRAESKDSPKIVAMSDVASDTTDPSAKKTYKTKEYAFCTAITVGVFENTANAYIGTAAELDALEAIKVQSDASLPWEQRFINLNLEFEGLPWEAGYFDAFLDSGAIKSEIVDFHTTENLL